MNYLALIILFLIFSEASAQKPKSSGTVETHLDLAETLDKKKHELELKEIELQKMKDELELQKQSIEKRIAYYEDLQKSISSKIDKKSMDDLSSVKEMTKMVEAMNPKAAAKMFEELDMDLARAILQRMSRKKSAEIMNKLPRDKAVKVSEYFAGFSKGQKDMTLESLERAERNSATEQAK